MRLASFAVCLLMIASGTTLPMASANEGCSTENLLALNQSSSAPSLLTDVKAEQSAHYASLLEMYSPDELESMDDDFAEFDMIDSQVLGSSHYSSSRHAQSAEETAEEEAIDQVADTTSEGSDASAAIVKTAVEFAKGSAPVLHTYVKINEASNHRDVWAFKIIVTAYDANCQELGDVSKELPYEDHYGKHDYAREFMELPLVEAAADVEEITTVEVRAFAELCRYGWISGNQKGDCLNGKDDGLIDVEYI